jgi:DNA-binding NarL/FixJ family response regulator
MGWVCASMTPGAARGGLIPCPMSDGARILLIDDHPAVRSGLALLLTLEHHEICGEAGSREEMLQQLDACQPQMALLDLQLGEQSGLDLIDDLRQRGIPVLVYSMHEDANTVSQVFARGAQGYVCKREVSDILLNAVREVLDGKRHVSPLAAQSLAGCLLAEADSTLSEREQQIIELLGQGCGKKEIAEMLAISVRTVESYCARAIEKLSVDGMKELRRYAIQLTRSPEDGQ